jgi:hypothetical protein
LIERADDEGIDLHGVDEAIAHRLHARRFIGLGDALPSGLSVRASASCPATGFSWPGNGKASAVRRPDRPGGSALSTAGRGIVVVDVRRNELVGAAGQALSSPASW